MTSSLAFPENFVKPCDENKMKVNGVFAKSHKFDFTTLETEPPIRVSGDTDNEHGAAVQYIWYSQQQ